MKKITNLLNLYNNNSPIKGLSRNIGFSEEILLLEDSLNFLPIFLKKNPGSFVNLKLFRFTDKSDFNFKVYKGGFTAEYKNLILSLNKVLFCLKKINALNTSNLVELILLKPIRGGFKAFQNGLVGFISLNDLKDPLNYLLKSFQSNLYYSKKLILLSKILNNLLLIRISFNNTLVFFSPQFYKKKFVKKYTKISSNSLNIIFKIHQLKKEVLFS
jgi:hypothetical protein